MKELIKIRKSPKTGNPIVNARDLHAFLEAKQDFSNWLKGRIKKFGFAENVDYARIFLILMVREYHSLFLASLILN